MSFCFISASIRKGFDSNDYEFCIWTLAYLILLAVGLQRLWERENSFNFGILLEQICFREFIQNQNYGWTRGYISIFSILPYIALGLLAIANNRSEYNGERRRTGDLFNANHYVCVTRERGKWAYQNN